MKAEDIKSPWKNLGEMFFSQAEKYRERTAMRRRKDGGWEDISWTRWRRDAECLAAGLVKLGIKPGEAVSIICNNRPEWLVADIGTFAAGAHMVPVYVTLLPPAVHYILDHGDVRVMFVENSVQLDKVLQIRKDLPKLSKIVLIDGAPPSDPDILTFAQLLALGENEDPARLRPLWENVALDGLATIIYTSGTTGPPKGVKLSHRNIIWVIASGKMVLNGRESDETLSFLPLCHAYERIGGLFAMISVGATINFTRSIDTLLDDLASARPTILLSVPRMLEKAYARVMQSLETSGPAKKALFNWALSVGRETSFARCRGRTLPPMQALKFKLADKLVYSKVKKRFGGRLRFIVSAGAPMSKDIEEFYHNLDITILEGYGMTELSAPSHLNKLGEIKFGSVGRAIPGVECKIAEDGEILVRAPSAFIGYHKLPEDTAEALQDGWMHTGDIGVIDDEGFLFVTDRKKDLIITSGGKNIAPQNIENMLKADPYISQAMVYGDRRKFLTALITIDEDTVKAHLAGKGIAAEGKTVAALPETRELIKSRVEKINENLASYETIKDFRVLDRDFSMDDGELTPTLKLKRKVIVGKYQDLLDGMYAE